MLTGCAEDWPSDGREWLEDRLAKGPKKLDCYRSRWTEKQGLEFPRPSVLQASECRIDPDDVEWLANDTAVHGIARCEGYDYSFEFAVTVFARDHYYSRKQGLKYHCEHAAAPKGHYLPELGEMTVRGTAMDGDFIAYDDYVKSEGSD